jgi:hypothetical protein
MVLLGLLLAIGASDASDEAIRQQAARCGVKPNQLVWSVDNRGLRRADLTPNGDLDSLSSEAVKCLIEWAQQSRARVGFVSEPPPTDADIAVLQRATRECHLHEGALTFVQHAAPREPVIRMTRAYGDTDEQFQCATRYFPDDFNTRFGLEFEIDLQR